MEEPNKNIKLKITINLISACLETTTYSHLYEWHIPGFQNNTFQKHETSIQLRLWKIIFTSKNDHLQIENTSKGLH